MADTKHTPAPWVKDESFVFAANGKRVADCECDDVAMTDEEIASNAALIAAAPDMLEALKNAHDRGYFDPHPDDSDEEREQKRYAIETIRKATNT